MTKVNTPIPLYKLALLQAYLYQVFSLENSCKGNFKNTEWYLKENFSSEQSENILKIFERLGLKCDCDIINKLDLKKISDGEFQYHN